MDLKSSDARVTVPELLRVTPVGTDSRHLWKQVALVLLLLLLFVGVASSTAGKHPAGSKPLAAIRQEKRFGPKPTPRWYWRWASWRLGTGFAKGHPRRQGLRPKQAPKRIPHWAWRRLHFFLLARASARAQHSSKQTNTGHLITPTHPKVAASARSRRPDGYGQAISYTRTRPSFTPKRVVDVSNAPELAAAIANLQPGDLVRATSSFTVSGETIISKRLASWAVLDLGSRVTFEYSGGQNVPAVYLDNPTQIRIYGGNLTTDRAGGSCILSHGMQHVLWWGFTCHDAGNTGVALYPVENPISSNDLQGEVYRAGENLSWDPHAERGSGLHGVNLDDDGRYPFSGNRFAFYIHDQAAGAGIEYGDAISSHPPVRNTIYEKAVNLGFVSRTQTGGNAIQFWGVGGQSADIKYLEVQNAQGYGLFAGGMYGGTSLSGVTVEYGRAANTNLNPRYAGQSPWDSSSGVIYKTLQPAP
jgi:hypothetical protein